MPLSSQNPTLLYSILWPIVDPILVTFGQMCNFRDPNLVSYYFYELTHFLDWMKNTLLFICSTNILVRLLTVNMKNCLTPKNPKMCDPILVTLLKMRPHYSQSSRENATPSSGTSPLASYKEVPPPTPQPGATADSPRADDSLRIYCLFRAIACTSGNQIKDVCTLSKGRSLPYGWGEDWGEWVRINLKRKPAELQRGM